MKKLLVIGYVWPEPGSSAAGRRMMQLLDFFLRKKFEVTFATTATKSGFAVDLESLGIKTAKIELNNVSFDDFLKSLHPEMVLFDRFMMEEQFGWRVTQTCPNALKILDTEDLHSLRKARETAYKKQAPVEDLLLTSELAKREIASIYRCDISLIISEAEVALLKTIFRIDDNLLFYLPFLPEEISEENISALPTFKERAHFLSIGNFLHEPNWHAVLYLKEKIWSLIHEKLPTVQVHIYGAYPSEKAFNLNNPSQGFLVKGRAENSEKVMQSARVCLAPLQFGAGLKGKFFDAMQCGTPSITTEVGAEGIAGDLDWNGFIENDPGAFATAAVNLYLQEDLWKKAQLNGFKILKTRFSKRLFEDAFVVRLTEIQEDLIDHRKQNFVGAMLQHHQHRSTYFMSRYIELKNQQK